MTAHAAEHSSEPQPLVIGVLGEGDVQDLQKWSERYRQDTLKHLSGMGKLALREALNGEELTPDRSQHLYGVYFSNQAAAGQEGRFVILTGDDAGTQINNHVDIYKRLGLPAGGPRAALETMKPTQMQGGLVHTFQPYEGTVKVRRNNEEIDDGWQVLAVTPDGTRAKVFKHQADGKTLTKLIPVADINPIPKPKADKPAPVDPQEAARQRAEAEKKRYDRMFSLPTAEDLRTPGVARRMEVTEQSVQDAAFAYRYSGSGIKDIFAKYKTKELWRESDMPELARTNNELRVELGTYLLNKLDTASYRAQMPYRIRINTSKMANHYGYLYLNQSFTSREWATMIALSMLDGTFKKADARPEPIVMYEDDNFKERISGQHRYAAYKLLETPKQAYQDQIVIKQ